MKQYYGDDARWFVGVVTNNLDPMQLGRVQVRIFGVHSRKVSEIPNYALPWATVLQPSTSGGTSGIGMMPQILPGAQVFGMFLDGKASQLPCIFGVMPKIEIPSEQQLENQQNKAIQYDIGYGEGQVDPRLARAAGINTYSSSVTGNSPASSGTVVPVGTTRVEQAFNFFTARGFTDKQSAGIVGNLIAEVGPNLPEHGPRGDGGRAAGIAQWHPGRRNIFEQVYGKPWQDSTFTDQLQFIVWELSNSDSHSGNLNKNAGDLLRATDSVTMAATIFDEKYERSSGAARQKRINYAHNVYDQFARV